MTETTPCLVCKHRRLNMGELSCSLDKVEFWEEMQGYVNNDKGIPLNVCETFKAGDILIEKE